MGTLISAYFFLLVVGVMIVLICHHYGCSSCDYTKATTAHPVWPFFVVSQQPEFDLLKKKSKP